MELTLLLGLRKENQNANGWTECYAWTESKSVESEERADTYSRRTKERTTSLEFSKQIDTVYCIQKLKAIN